MSEPATPTRRSYWLVFVAVILLVILIVGGVAGPFVLPVVQLTRTVRRLRDAGVEPGVFDVDVLPDWQRDSASRVFPLEDLQGATVLELTKLSIHDDDLVGLYTFSKLNRLDLSGQPVTIRGVRAIQNLPLQRLWISNTHVGSGGCKSLAGTNNSQNSRTIAATLGSLDELEWLMASDSRLADGDLSQISNLKRLEMLELERTCVTSRGMSDVGQLVSLKHLHLSGTKLTDEGVASLKKLKSLILLRLAHTEVTGTAFRGLPTSELRYLYLDNSSVTDAGVLAITQQKQLRGLELSNCKQLTDEGCRALAGLPDLNFLQLDGSPITDASIGDLCRLRSLENLGVSDTRLTWKAVGALQTLPNLRTLRISADLLKSPEVVSQLALFPRLQMIICKTTDESRAYLAAVRKRLGSSIYVGSFE